MPAIAIPPPETARRGPPPRGDKGNAAIRQKLGVQVVKRVVGQLFQPRTIHRHFIDVEVVMIGIGFIARQGARILRALGLHIGKKNFRGIITQPWLEKIARR